MKILLISALIGTSLAVLVFACFKKYVSPYDDYAECHKEQMESLRQDIYHVLEGNYALDTPFAGKDRIKFEIAGNKGIYTYYKFLYQPAIFEIVECDIFVVTATSDYLQIKTKFLYLNSNFYWCEGVLKDIDTNFKFLKQ